MKSTSRSTARMDAGHAGHAKDGDGPLAVHEADTEVSEGLSRRSFLTGALAATAVASAGALVGCGGTPKAAAVDEKAAAPAATDWLGSEPVIETIDETIETEVLVAGGGTGGLFAACAAAEEGAQVVVLEKSTFSGGVRDNIAAINSRLQQENNCVIDTEGLLLDMTRYANGQCDARLHRLWANISGEMVDWYQDRIEERDLQLFHEADFTNNETLYRHYATGHIPSWPADAEFAGIPVEVNGKHVLGDYARSKGAEFHFETRMIKLVKEGARVVGAIAQDGDGRYIQINASKGVIVATGGYAWNQEMLDALQPHTQNMYSLCIAVPGTEGDGIKACLWAGAKMDDTHLGMVFDRVAVMPNEVGGHETTGKMMWIGSNPWLKVNLKGERYCNESSPYSYCVQAATTQPDNTFCTIWDSDWERYVAQFDIHGCARVVPFDNGAPTNVPLEAEKAMNAALIEEGYIQQADTIEELAEKLNIPADAFAATVARQNENFDNQTDPDFGKEPFRLSALRTAPFFGARTSGYLLCTLDGIQIDTNVQALDAKGSPIEGLYVVGNDSGSYYSNIYPNLSTGNAAGRTCAFGRRAGKIAATGSAD
ncbi:MAG: FAD-binding protein [Coriobacteriales bacterium]|nr:FAD-binding protein [Coriobacteriales bacterium]